MKHLNPRQGITTSAPDVDGSHNSSCETPKSPPGDYNRPLVGSLPGRRHRPCETPKSPPGDYNGCNGYGLWCRVNWQCETPKSPPGDYNVGVQASGNETTAGECETPKSPPGDYNFLSPPPCGGGTCPTRVKHLNPRQGITTSRTYRDMIRRYSLRGVKHLNPRQGITTAQAGVWTPSATSKKCETPKSPPGDYNLSV